MFTLSNGDIHEEVNRLRFFVSAGAEHRWLRASDVWYFFARRKGCDCFVTSSSLRGEMKGTVHRTQAHFGFNKPFREAVPENWVGPIPPSRLYHRLEIKDLAEGECQPVFVTKIPGFALANSPSALEPKKTYVQIDAPPPNIEINLRLTLGRGDWKSAFVEGANERSIGLMTLENGRFAIVSVALLSYRNVDAAIANVNRNLALVPHVNMPNRDEASVHFWMHRADDDPIAIMELNRIQVNQGG